MKKLIIIGLFFLSLFLFGCKKNDLNKDEVDALNALDSMNKKGNGKSKLIL